MATSRILVVWVVTSLWLGAGCMRPQDARWGAPATPPGRLGPAPPTTLVGAPLPPGWAWPVAAQAVARGLTALAVYRPINLSVLEANRGKRCAPAEVAPGIWITPLCAPLPRFSASSLIERLTPAVVSGPLPEAVDLRQAGLDGPVKDQQQAGVCWSFALSSLMDNGLRRAGRGDVMAPLHLIADDEFTLLFRKGAGRPLVTEPSWPYDPRKACELDSNPSNRWCESSYNVPQGSWRSDPVVVAERSRAEATGVYSIRKMHTLAPKPGRPDEIASVLAAGQAVYAGFGIDSRVWSNQRHQPGSVIADWNDDGQGGHAVALVGYRSFNGQRQFLVHNSWGTSWGDGGYAWISERMVRERLDEALVVSLATADGRDLGPSGQGGPGPTPGSIPGLPPIGMPSWPLPFPMPFPFPAPGAGVGTGTEAPITRECPSGQVRDAMLPACVNACPDGSAPTAFVCMPAGAGAPPFSHPGCPTGQLADWVTGQCAPTCPGGGPRVAGMCLP